MVHPIYRTMEWDGVALGMPVDTGSPVTIITWPTYTKYLHLWPLLQKTTLQLTCFLGQLPVKGQLNISVTYSGTTLEATLVVLGCSGPDLCGRDVIKAFEQQHGRQVLAVGMKAAPDTEHPGTTRQVGDSVWYRNYGTGARWKAGVVQAPEGHRMVTIKAADGEHRRRHYDQLSARETDSPALAAGEAEVKQEPGVQAPQTKAGETGAPLTSREGPQSLGAPDADSRPNTHDNEVGNDVSGAQSDGNQEFDPGETVMQVHQKPTSAGSLPALRGKKADASSLAHVTATAHLVYACPSEAIKSLAPNKRCSLLYTRVCTLQNPSLMSLKAFLGEDGHEPHN
ncbi:uncharacterized protein LOC119382029 [Rhipicephalus sanguineus]|uniref:uncharacterized protein LOC119382029 n=1 Tax=Rhipicephalus sanguineus TaxID=34632 RepID=UPI0020C329BA|nr:uncharacterized protein LOC119382029 [Rhipicephalus sanguineus]